MPTYPSFDPANLPPYPEKPHKTGQARVNVDGKSQYLGKYGTVESHALYHMACARKLITGVVPTTRELRDEVSQVACHEDTPRPMTPSLMTVIALIVVVAMTSGALSHYVTKASVRNGPLPTDPLQHVVTQKPVIPNNDIGKNSTEGDNQTEKQLSPLEKTVVDLERDYPLTNSISVVDKIKSAVERIVLQKSERSQEHAKDVEESEARKNS